MSSVIILTTQAHLHVHSSPLVIADFDKTITVKDTVEALAEGAIATSQCTTPWSYFVNAFVEDYERHQQAYPPPQYFPDLGAFAQYRESFRHVEETSIHRVSDCKIFAGLSREDLASMARETAKTMLQPGVIDTLQKIAPNFHIVSLNWSKDWINGFLEPFQLPYDQIHSNDLTFRDGISTGQISTTVLTTMDKMKVVEAIISTQPKHVPTVYLGDSIGDLLPLVKCNVGIIIGQDPELLDTLQKYGVQIREGLDTVKPSRKNTVYRVDSWHQIAESGILTNAFQDFARLA